MADRELLRRLAGRVARGQAVGWDSEERNAATEEERRAIRELRVVAAMTAFNDAVQSEDDTDLASSIDLAKSVVHLGDPGVPGTEPVAPSLAPGSRWGHLEILECIGRGAFGEVYRARDTRLDRIVALKLLGREMPGPANDEAVREARLLAKVRHPHVVTVHGADRIDGRIGIWMEYVRGETLDRLLKQRGVLDAREAALIGIDLCRALSAVHAAGIAHRDVKLANVMRAEGGRIVLMDFGLGHEAPRGAKGRRLSRKLSGTPLFMAPEVLQGAREDPRSDVYSLGVVLFSLVTGALPVQASTLSDLMSRHEKKEARRARDLRPDLPEGFEHCLDRALDPNPDTRFQTAGEAEKALLNSLGAAVAAPAARRPGGARRWLIPAAGLVGLAILAGFVATRWNPSKTAAPGASPRAPFAEVPDLTILGEGNAGLFGLTVSGLGDVDHDGFDDVAVAAPLQNVGGAFDGKIYLYRGGPKGLDPTPAWTLALPDSGLYLGQDIAPFTNLSLDGLPDLVVGAPGFQGARVWADGRVLVFSNSRSGLGSRPTQILKSGTPRSLFGYSVSTGDVNHDGRDDLLVGEPLYPPGPSGRAHLYMSMGDSFAPTPAWTFAGPESSYFGIEVALGGDLNNDGYGDAVIGAPTEEFGPRGEDTGAAYIFLGSATGLDTIPIILHGRQAYAKFGQAVIFAGDLDADGFQDLFVGAEEAANGERSEGIGEIYFGSAGGVSPYGSVLLESNVMGANFGGHAGTLGDVDGDGCDDFYVGALRYQRNAPRAGAAFIFSGSRERAIRRSWFRLGIKGGTWYGAAGGAAGDVNGDGFPDFLVAGPSYDTEVGENTGMIEIFLNNRTR